MSLEIKDKLDYSDYLAAPDDGKTYEIINGDLYVAPAPSPLHQRFSRRLQRQLEDYFHVRSLAEVFDSPIDLILTNADVVQPDLLVVADPAQVSKRGIEGAPLLVVEVLSPSTRKRDLSIKARRYAELEIPHYWVVDPDHKRLECHRLEAGTYKKIVEGTSRGELLHPDWDGLALDLTAIFR